MSCRPWWTRAIELGRGSFFGEPAVLGFAQELARSIVCTRSCTMMTLNQDHMDELCQPELRVQG